MWNLWSAILSQFHYLRPSSPIHPCKKHLLYIPLRSKGETQRRCDTFRTDSPKQLPVFVRIMIFFLLHHAPFWRRPQHIFLWPIVIVARFEFLILIPSSLHTL
jgi:hypothetical protein